VERGGQFVLTYSRAAREAHSWVVEYIKGHDGR
jgi:hypothetical protein